MTNRLPYATEHARRCGDLRASFERATADSFKDFRVGMTQPEGTTGGGARAHQHLLLTSREGVSIVVGWANAVDKTAELRTLGAIFASTKLRFGAEVEISPREYVEFLDAASRVLRDAGLDLHVISFAAEPAASPDDDEVPVRHAARSSAITRLALLFTSVVTIAGALGWMVGQ